MNYKYKVYLDTDDLCSDKYDAFRNFSIDKRYRLIIELVKSEIITNIKLSIVNEKDELIISKDYRFSNESKIYRIYKLTSDKIKDEFMIKLFSNNNLNQLENKYSSDDVKNEIQFVNFNDKYELMDLCALMLTRHVGEELKKMFKNRFLYYGYKNLEDLTENKRVDDIVDDILKIETDNENIIKNFFYLMTIIDTDNEYYYTDPFYEKIKYGYEKIYDQRLENLKTYFIL